MLSWNQAMWVGLVLVGSSGCATPGTRPHDMSTAAHEKAAMLAEAEATEHAARFDASQATSNVVCSRAGCRSQDLNPTKVHLEDAAQLRQVASEHRQAGEALQTEVGRACQGETGRTASLAPFFKPGYVERVEPSYRYARGRQVSGATIVLANVPGLSAAAVQHDLDCHLALYAAAGFDAAEMSYCPLASRGVRAVAREESGRVVVDIRTAEQATAGEVLRRAQLLVRR
jgi:hypothetical protein